MSVFVWDFKYILLSQTIQYIHQHVWRALILFYLPTIHFVKFEQTVC